MEGCKERLLRNTDHLITRLSLECLICLSPEMCVAVLILFPDRGLIETRQAVAPPREFLMRSSLESPPKSTLPYATYFNCDKSFQSHEPDQIIISQESLYPQRLPTATSKSGRSLLGHSLPAVSGTSATCIYHVFHFRQCTSANTLFLLLSVCPSR